MKNIIGQSLKITGLFIIIVGVILGLAFGQTSDNFNILVAIIYWGIGIICGLVLLALGEIVNLLQGIYNSNIKSSLTIDRNNSNDFKSKITIPNEESLKKTNWSKTI